MLVNLVIFLLAINRLHGYQKSVYSELERELKMRRIRATLTLAVVLGLTWMSGLALIDNNHPGPQWIFAVLVSIQGFLIFIFQIFATRISIRLDPRTTSRRTSQVFTEGNCTSSLLCISPPKADPENPLSTGTYTQTTSNVSRQVSLEPRQGRQENFYVPMPGESSTMERQQPGGSMQELSHPQQPGGSMQELSHPHTPRTSQL